MRNRCSDVAPASVGGGFRGPILPAGRTGHAHQSAAAIAVTIASQRDGGAKRNAVEPRGPIASQPTPWIWAAVTVAAAAPLMVLQPCRRMPKKSGESGSNGPRNT